MKLFFVLLTAVSLASCGDNGTGNTGSTPPLTYTVSGAISPSLAGVTVQLIKSTSTTSTLTTTDGSYSFSGVDNGLYVVKPNYAGYTFNPGDRSININRNLQGVNFTATVIPSGFSISGRITQNNTALPGITMRLTGTAIASSETVTDTGGKYSFAGLATSTYTLTPQPQAGLTFTLGSLMLSNITSNIFNQDFTVASAIVTRNYTLYIKPGTLTINGNGGTTLAAWGYTDVATGLPMFPGPQLSANAGDTVTVTVVNNHNIEHNFMIKGVTSDTAAIAAGASKIYSFIAASDGTYLYFDTLNNDVNREMGLYGALIVGPDNGTQYVWSGGPAYDFQRIWIVSEMDSSRWNTVAGAGGSVDTAVYKPNYFLINGQSGSDGMANAATTIEGTVGQTALVRIVNPGQFTNSLHFHGNHIQVLTVNGVRQTSPYKELDVINIPPLATADVLYYLNQPGEYPMHNHIAQMETANGVYLNGIVTMIKMH